MSDIEEIKDIKNIGKSTVSKLRKAGYIDFEAIAVKSAGDFQEEANIGEKTAAKLINEARDRLNLEGFSTAGEIYEERQKEKDLKLNVPEFDDVMGGGLKTNQITEFYGGNSSGKSQIVHQLAVNVQLPEEVGGLHGRAFLIDTESSFTPTRIRSMVKGLDDDVLKSAMEEEDEVKAEIDNEEEVEKLADIYLDRIHVGEALSSNHQILLTEELPVSEYKDSDYPPRLIAVDSLIAQMRAEYTGRGNLAERQQKLSKHLRDLDEKVTHSKAVGVITNQVQSNPDKHFGDPTKPTGGNIVGHTSTYRVYLKNSKGNKRILELVDAPDLPDGEAVMRLEQDGIKPE